MAHNTSTHGSEATFVFCHWFNIRGSSRPQELQWRADGVQYVPRSMLHPIPSAPSRYSDIPAPAATFRRRLRQHHTCAGVNEMTSINAQRRYSRGTEARIQGLERPRCYPRLLTCRWRATQSPHERHGTFKYITFRTHSHMHTGADITRTVPERALALPARCRRPGRTITLGAEARSMSAALIQRRYVRSTAASAPLIDAVVEVLDEAADADNVKLPGRRAAHRWCHARARLARSCHANGRGRGDEDTDPRWTTEGHPSWICHK